MLSTSQTSGLGQKQHTTAAPSAKCALHLVYHAHVLDGASLVCSVGLSGVGVGDLIIAIVVAPAVAMTLPAAG